LTSRRIHGQTLEPGLVQDAGTVAQVDRRRVLPLGEALVEAVERAAEVPRRAAA
jgi:hypothetical protein